MKEVSPRTLSLFAPSYVGRPAVGHRAAVFAVLVLVMGGCSLPDLGDQTPESPGVPLAAVGAGGSEDPSTELPPGISDEDFTIASVSPVEGLVTGNTEVQLIGTGLRAGMSVYFGESEALDLFVVSPTLAVMRTPPHPAGLVNVSATHPDVDMGLPRDLELAYRFYADLIITGVTPAAGTVYGGDAVTVTGSGFAEDAAFFIGGRAALSQARVDDNTLIGISPPGQFGPADVHVVSAGATARAPDAFNYQVVPELERVTPVTGPAAGGTPVRLIGVGLTANSVVFFDDIPVEPLAADRGGRWLDVESPAGPPGDVVDVSVANGSGLALAELAWAWKDPSEDPFALSCTTLSPSVGPMEGGGLVQLACNGLQYPATVTFGAAQADVVSSDPAAGILTVVSPSGTGTVWVQVSNAFDATTVPVQFSYTTAPTMAVTAVTPSTGPVAGGTEVVVTGKGFATGAAVFVGALPATGVVVESSTELRLTTPLGTPGLADIRIVQGGEQFVAPESFEFTDETLRVTLVTPPVVAQSGGTYLRVFGTGFDPGATVRIGDQACEAIVAKSGAQLHVRSPALEVGVYDAVVTNPDGAEARLPGAVTVYDPRSGYGGTWGESIDETVNITVRGYSGYGPIEGAFVMLGDDPNTSLKGYTDANGQITISEPGLYGPVVVTATHPDFNTYSIVLYDAANATIFLSLTDPPPGTPGPSVSWPPATLRGRVLGLGKYVLPPPGSCEGLAIDATEHCKPCEPSVGCDGASFGCTDVKEQGYFCAAECLAPSDCPEGYACTPSLQGQRCLPAPGEKIAKCMVSNSSPFSGEPLIQEGGWVPPYGSFELTSARLGELAIVCFGGYRDDTGLFTPTVMGLRRHVFAMSDIIQEDLDVSLDYPLNRTFRLRLMDPPKPAGGVENPDVTISLDLGPDGWIPFSRKLTEVGDDVWLATRQLGRLSGQLDGAKYFFYTQIAAPTAASPGALRPRSYNLINGVDTVNEDRLPRLIDGQWELEQAQLDADLYGLWGPNSDQLYAVGEGGLILLNSGGIWTAQSSGTDATLRAIAGRAGDDVYAVGDRGTVLHHAGTGWQPLDAPKDQYRAAATATGQPLYVAGTIRVRMWDGNSWAIAGPPNLQDIHALDVREDGIVLAAGSGGRIFVRDNAGLWTGLPPITAVTLRGITRDTTGWLVVGDEGTVVSVSETFETSLVQVPTTFDLTAATLTPGGVMYVVGDNGLVMRRWQDAWALEEVEDYRSRAHAVFALPSGDPQEGEVRIVGSAAFILGPILHWPTVTEPLHDSDLDAPTVAWTIPGGPLASYTQLSLSEEFGKLLWRLIIDGPATAVNLPDIFAASGIDPLKTGKRRVELLRVLNPDFTIDGYTTRDFGVYRRDSWAINQAYFYAP